MTLFTAILTFILGSAVGSFLSVIVYRMRHRKSGILWGRSVDSTAEKGERLKWYHLIPIFSFIFLRGRSAFTGKKISVHYLLLELVTGLAFLVIFLQWNFIQPIASTIDISLYTYSIDWEIFQRFVFYAIEFSLLIGIFFYDLLYKEIPDQFSIPAIVIALAGALLFGVPTTTSALLGGLVIFLFFLVQFVLSKGTWIGGGDLRMGALMGALLGFEYGIAALIVSYIVGALVSIFLILIGKASRKTAIPFGPFLIIGTTTIIFFGEEIVSYYMLNFVG